MSDKVRPIGSLFKAGYRRSGVLLHVTSLPSPYGIGDLGPGAFAWIDRLHESGQRWWQALPLGPTGYFNSPYQPLSSFVGNWLLISPDGLIEDGLLRPEDCPRIASTSDACDYDAVIEFKRGLLEPLWNHFNKGARPDLIPEFQRFCHDRAHWLDEFALFRALKARFNDTHFLEWPAELVRRNPEALARAREELAHQIDRIRLAQFVLFRQASSLKAHARSKGVRLIGDLPFFVSGDSSDVWANPDLFLLKEDLRPQFVAGVPPDYFSSEGQLWGNPMYDWDALRNSGYRWFIDRIRALLEHVDVIRLDHFLAFSAAWHIPAGAPTAKDGEWRPGPGPDLFAAILREFGTLPFIAEDLGLVTPEVVALRDQFSIPGTRVLQFAFDGSPDNPHLPHNFVPNSVVYTGTHDNPTTREWHEDSTEDTRRRLDKYVNRTYVGSNEAAAELIRLAWFSVSALAIAPLQDVLNLGKEARMNVPGRAEGNWSWRCTKDMFEDAVWAWLLDLTVSSNRLSGSDEQAIS